MFSDKHCEIPTCSTDMFLDYAHDFIADLGKYVCEECCAALINNEMCDRCFEPMIDGRCTGKDCLNG